MVKSESGISIIEEARLCHLQQYFFWTSHSVPTWRGPLMTIADDRGQKISQQTGVLAVHIIMPWAPVAIHLVVTMLPGGDGVHI